MVEDSGTLPMQINTGLTLTPEDAKQRAREWAKSAQQAYENDAEFRNALNAAVAWGVVGPGEIVNTKPITFAKPEDTVVVVDGQVVIRVTNEEPV